MEFKIPIKEEKIKPHQITTLHMVCALAFLGTGTIIAVYNYTITGWGFAVLALGIALTYATMFRNKWILTPSVNRNVRIVELITSLIIAAYSFYQQWKFPEVIFGVLSASVAYALFWEKTAGETLFVFVNDEGLHLPVTSRKRFIKWAEVENVVFRHGTLSINCVDDRLFQWTAGKTDVSATELEEYSDTQVEQHKTEREEDW